MIKNTLLCKWRYQTVSLLRLGIKLIIAGIISIMLLSGFTVVYCNSGIHITNTTGATDYKWESGQLKTTMTEGFAWFRMDENGFNNAYSIEEKVNNLLMGSSHMEAVEVNPHKNTGYLLNDMGLGYTYNIGTSGHQIYNCVRNLSDAVNEYKPSGYVLLETDKIELDPDSMKKVLDGTYPHIPSYDTGIIYQIQKYAPAIKHLYNQIDVWRTGVNGITDSDINVDVEYENLLEEFLSKAQENASQTGARLVIFYQPKTIIDNEGIIISDTNSDALELFKSVCEENDIMFLDMTEPFLELYANEHILAHGFFNTGVGVGHLNKYGHQVIAKQLAEVIMEDRAR